VTFLTALGTNLSALWILVANGWMQNPVGAEFNLETMRMEMTSFAEVFFNPVAQVKFIHTVAAGYVAAPPCSSPASPPGTCFSAATWALRAAPWRWRWASASPPSSR